MKNILHHLRLLGFVLFIASRWLDVLTWPSIILIGLTSLGLLYYWRENRKSDNIWNIVILLLCLLEIIGI